MWDLQAEVGAVDACFTLHTGVFFRLKNIILESWSTIIHGYTLQFSNVRLENACSWHIGHFDEVSALSKTILGRVHSQLGWQALQVDSINLTDPTRCEVTTNHCPTYKVSHSFKDSPSFPMARVITNDDPWIIWTRNSNYPKWTQRSQAGKRFCGSPQKKTTGINWVYPYPQVVVCWSNITILCWFGATPRLLFGMDQRRLGSDVAYQRHLTLWISWDWLGFPSFASPNLSLSSPTRPPAAASEVLHRD